MPHIRKSPNRVSHIFGHISAKNYPTVCFFGLHMLFCHPGNFFFYDLQPKSDDGRRPQKPEIPPPNQIHPQPRIWHNTQKFAPTQNL